MKYQKPTIYIFTDTFINNFLKASPHYMRTKIRLLEYQNYSNKHVDIVVIEFLKNVYTAKYGEYKDRIIYQKL